MSIAVNLRTLQRRGWLGQLLLDGGLDASRRCRAGPALLDLAVAADQELLKVPLDALHSKDARLALLQPLVQRVGLVTVDVDLAEDRKGDAVVDLAEALNLIVGTWVLATELVAWKADDLEVWVGGLELCRRLWLASGTYPWKIMRAMKMTGSCAFAKFCSISLVWLCSLITNCKTHLCKASQVLQTAA